MGSELVITCLRVRRRPDRPWRICEERIPTWRGDIRVECRCGAEYHARSGQLVEEPICGLLSAQ